MKLSIHHFERSFFGPLLCHIASVYPFPLKKNRHRFVHYIISHWYRGIVLKHPGVLIQAYYLPWILGLAPIASSLGLYVS